MSRQPLLAPHGITVNAVSPRVHRLGVRPAEELEKMVKNIPAGYIGKTDDALDAFWTLAESGAYPFGQAGLTTNRSWSS